LHCFRIWKELEKERTWSLLAKETNISRSKLSLMANKLYKISSEHATLFEVFFGLNFGDFDLVHENDHVKIDAALSGKIAKNTIVLMDENKIIMSPDDFSEFISIAYDSFRGTHSVSKSLLLKLLRNYIGHSI